MAKRRQVVEIYSPVLGIKSDMMPELLDPRAAATGQNFKCFFGINQKEYGTSLWATSTSAVLNGAPTFLFAATFPAISILQAATPTKFYRYDAGADTFLNDGQVYTGTYTDFWQGVMFSDKLIFTNGKDPIQIKQTYNGTATNLGSAISPTTFNAWCIQPLNAFLCLYHTFENQTEYFKRVRWSAQAPLTYLAGTTDFASGLAGAQDIDDGEGNLMAAVPLAGGVVLYFENSIHYQVFVGGDAVFAFQKMIPGIGIPGRRCVYGYQDVNYFITNNNVYRYYGGYYVDAIGEPVKKAMFSELNQAAVNTAWIDFDKREGELLVYIPTGTSTQPDTCWVYRVDNQAWTRKIRNHTSSTNYGKQTGLTIGQLQGPISAQNFTFGEASVKAQANTKIFGDPAGYVVKHDITVYSQNISGTQVAQVYQYDTPDITGNKGTDPEDGSASEFVSTMQRWQRLTTEVFGNGTMQIFYSVDHGVTYTELSQSPITLTANGQVYFLDMDVTSPFIRIRFQNSGLNEFCAVRYAKLDYIPGQPF